MQLLGLVSTQGLVSTLVLLLLLVLVSAGVGEYSRAATGAAFESTVDAGAYIEVTQ